MAVICPTVTAAEPHEFRAQIERIQPFAGRIHIDLADGRLAPNKLIELSQVWWPADITADIHLMFERPEQAVDDLLRLRPSLVIIHAEANEPFEPLARQLKSAGLKVGLALLPTTSVVGIETKLADIDHILIFSGELGRFGGHADMAHLSKVGPLKAVKQGLEFGWDGGIDDQNARQLLRGGIDVLNVGGFIQRSPDPAAAYAKLKAVTQDF